MSHTHHERGVGHVRNLAGAAVAAILGKDAFSRKAGGVSHVTRVQRDRRWPREAGSVLEGVWGDWEPQGVAR